MEFSNNLLVLGIYFDSCGIVQVREICVKPQSEQVSPAAALTSPPATVARSDSELQVQLAQPKEKEKKKRTEKKLVKTKHRIVVPKSSMVDTGDRQPEDDEEEVEMQEEVQEGKEEGDAGEGDENGEAKRATEEPPVHWILESQL